VRALTGLLSNNAYIVSRCCCIPLKISVNCGF